MLFLRLQCDVQQATDQLPVPCCALPCTLPCAPPCALPSTVAFNLQLSDMELTKQQGNVMAALKQGNEALKKAQAEVRTCCQTWCCWRCLHQPQCQYTLQLSAGVHLLLCQPCSGVLVAPAVSSVRWCLEHDAACASVTGCSQHPSNAKLLTSYISSAGLFETSNADLTRSVCSSTASLCAVAADAAG